MAVVREGTTSSGVRYRIMDDAYAGASAEEIARRRAHANRIAHKILTEYAMRQSECINNSERRDEE